MEIRSSHSFQTNIAVQVAAGDEARQAKDELYKTIRSLKEDGVVREAEKLLGQLNEIKAIVEAKGPEKRLPMLLKQLPNFCTRSTISYIYEIDIGLIKNIIGCVELGEIITQPSYTVEKLVQEKDIFGLRFGHTVECAVRKGKNPLKELLEEMQQTLSGGQWINCLRAMAAKEEEIMEVQSSCSSQRRQVSAGNETPSVDEAKQKLHKYIRSLKEDGVVRLANEILGQLHEIQDVPKTNKLSGKQIVKLLDQLPYYCAKTLTLIPGEIWFHQNYLKKIEYAEIMIQPSYTIERLIQDQSARSCPWSCTVNSEEGKNPLEEFLTYVQKKLEEDHYTVRLIPLAKKRYKKG